MAADYKHLNRLMDIYMLIQGGQGWNARRLAEKFNVTVRTIRRDLRVLEQAGIPIQYDPERACYQIRGDFFMPPLELTFPESLALVSLGRYIHANDQIPFSHPALKALAKIRGQLPPGIRRELDLVEDHLAVKLAPAATQECCADLYEIVRQSLSTRRCLRCSYESPRNNPHPEASSKPEYFLLKPYALFFCQRAWYVVGYHGLRDGIRTLKLNRFTVMELTSQAYVFDNAFSLEKYLGNAWRMIRGEKTYHVQLHFDASFAETITDTAWHPTQTFEHGEDGSLHWRCTVDGLDEIVWWILSMGAHCRVLEPPELIARVREEASRMLAIYAGSASQHAEPNLPSKGEKRGKHLVP